MPTLGTVSERIRSKRADHARWAAEMDARLDKLDDIESRARPIIERELQEQERSVESLENDASVMEKLAAEVGNGGPTLSPQPQPRSGGDAASAPRPEQRPDQQIDNRALDGTERSQLKWTP